MVDVMNITHENLIAELETARKKFVDDLMKNHYWTKSMVLDNTSDIDLKVKSNVYYDLASKLNSAHNIDYYTSYAIIRFITPDFASNDILDIIKQYQNDDLYIKLFYNFSLYSAIPIDIVAKEIALIENKEYAIKSTAVKFYAEQAFLNHPECKELSISNICNLFANHSEITEEQIRYIGFYRFEDIAYGSMTLEEVLYNTSEYYSDGSYNTAIGLKPFSLCLAESLNSFFHIPESQDLLHKIYSNIILEQILVDEQIQSDTSSDI
jgi:hypothetical protein